MLLLPLNIADTIKLVEPGEINREMQLVAQIYFGARRTFPVVLIIIFFLNKEHHYL
jgi:hypothetical protein